MNNHALEDLQAFGLSEKEAKVYLSALQLGRSTADQLSKHSGVNRSTTYVQIEELMKMGLMSTHEEGKKTYFNAESPENLKRLYESRLAEFTQKGQALNALIPSLLSIHQGAGERPVVRFFEGKEGLSTMRSDALKMKSKEILMLISYDDMLRMYTEKELYAFSNTRASKGIATKVIYTKEEGDNMVPVPPMEMRRIEKKAFPFESDIYIYDNTVAIASLTEKIFGIVIESQAVASSARALHQLAWESASKRSQI